VRSNALRALLIGAALLAVPAAWAQNEKESVRFNQIDLQAEASREVQNDLMSATLFTEANDANPAMLANTLNRTTNDALKVAGEVKSVKARSGGTHTFPIYDRNNKAQGWRGRSEIRLESSDFAAMSALIGKLQSTMQLGGVNFQVSPELRRKTENELMSEAIAAFRARGDIAAKAIGGRGYKIRRISVGSAGAPPPRPVIAMRQQSAASATVEQPTFEGGTAQVQVSVTGTIEVE
jgi:predicted secreted protein